MDTIWKLQSVAMARIPKPNKNRMNGNCFIPCAPKKVNLHNKKPKTKRNVENKRFLYFLFIRPYLHYIDEKKAFIDFPLNSSSENLNFIRSASIKFPMLCSSSRLFILCNYDDTLPICISPLAENYNRWSEMTSKAAYSQEYNDEDSLCGVSESFIMPEIFFASSKKIMYTIPCLRGVAQLGSARGLGPWGRGFESLHPDHLQEPFETNVPNGSCFCAFRTKRWDLTTYVPIHTWINGNLFSDPFDLLKKARSMKIRNGLFENMEMKGVEPLSKNTSGEVSTSVVYFHWFPKILQNKQKRICGSFIDLTGAQSLAQEVSRYCWDRSARYGSMQRAGYLRQRMLIDYYQQLYLIALIYVNSLTARFFSIRIPVETGASPQRIAIIP